jgi:hypothetical protein
MIHKTGCVTVYTVSFFINTIFSYYIDQTGIWVVVINSFINFEFRTIYIYNKVFPISIFPYLLFIRILYCSWIYTDSQMANNLDDQPPAWAQHLIERITSLEATIAQQPSPPPHDPNVVLRTPGSDFTPPEEVLEHFPHMTEDFFKRTLDDIDRRRFLLNCPKNTLRQYTPPETLKVHTSNEAKATDNQLHEIQYRLSGITRPIDWYVYQLIAQPLHDDPEANFQRSLDFAISIHELLSDLASHVTELRTANLYKTANAITKPPSLSGSTNLLVDPKTFVDHINLAKSVQQATSKSRPRPQSSKKSFTKSTHGSTTANSSHQAHPTDQSKGYDSARGQRAPQPSTSSGFQQRSSKPKP